LSKILSESHSLVPPSLPHCGLHEPPTRLDLEEVPVIPRRLGTLLPDWAAWNLVLDYYLDNLSLPFKYLS